MKFIYLGGAQSFLVQSINVPTYVLPRHVTLTTKTPVCGQEEDVLNDVNGMYYYYYLRKTN
jgi:hypothetical protein